MNLSILSGSRSPRGSGPKQVSPRSSGNTTANSRVSPRSSSPRLEKPPPERPERFDKGRKTSPRRNTSSAVSPNVLQTPPSDSVLSPRQKALKILGIGEDEIETATIEKEKDQRRHSAFPGVALRTLKRVGPQSRSRIMAQDDSHESLELNLLNDFADEMSTLSDRSDGLSLTFQLTEEVLESDEDEAKDGQDFVAGILNFPFLVKRFKLPEVPTLTEKAFEKIISYVFDLSVYYKIDSPESQYFINADSACYMILAISKTDVRILVDKNCEPAEFLAAQRLAESFEKSVHLFSFSYEESCKKQEGETGDMAELVSLMRRIVPQLERMEKRLESLEKVRYKYFDQ